MTIRHILGISGVKDSAALFIGNPLETSRRSVGSFHFLILLHESYNSFVPYHFKRLLREEKAFFLSKNTIKKTFIRFLTIQ